NPPNQLFLDCFLRKKWRQTAHPVSMATHNPWFKGRTIGRPPRPGLRIATVDLISWGLAAGH
ncbi:hypothetical protein, partial [Hydrogenophaga sp.]|uniref:hypothetical protein n=1 Tax=Hydrogenophaga sp. TaxID=1904254 RepID=UPI0025C5A526